MSISHSHSLMCLQEVRRSSKATWQMVSPVRKSITRRAHLDPLAAEFYGSHESEKVDLEGTLRTQCAPRTPADESSPAPRLESANTTPKSSRSHKSPLSRLWKSVTSWRRSSSRPHSRLSLNHVSAEQLCQQSESLVFERHEHRESLWVDAGECGGQS